MGKSDYVQEEDYDGKKAQRLRFFNWNILSMGIFKVRNFLSPVSLLHSTGRFLFSAPGIHTIEKISYKLEVVDQPFSLSCNRDCGVSSQTGFFSLL